MSDAARALPESVSALPPGTRVAEFEIRGLLGVGGFGIVYLAFDHALEREVAVKEYMPAAMAGRTETLHVSLRSQSDAEVFALGLKSFVNEARLLARFDHPSLIKVHRFWEANGTAYMAMPVLRGRTLKDIRRSTGRAPDEAWIRATVTPLLGALELLHREGVYHRDIAPDNIHLETEGHPVLLDFGAARRVIGGKTQTLTTILKPAYAPIEQYGESGAVKQGPWTDLYALGATLHYMLLGYPPAPATARTVSDEATELLTREMPGVSAQLLGIVDWMLAPKPADRPQSVAELRAVLEGRVPVPARARATAPPAAWDKTLVTSPITVPLPEEPRPDLELDDLGTADGPGTAHVEVNPGLPAQALPRAPRPTVDRGRAPATSVSATAAATPRPDRAGGRLAAGHTVRPGLAATASEPLPLAADDAHRLPPPQGRSLAVPLALVGVMAAGLAGYVGWTRFGTDAPGVRTASAASAPVSSVLPIGAASAAVTLPARAAPPASSSEAAAAAPVLPAASASVEASAPNGTPPAAAPNGTPPAAAADGADAAPARPSSPMPAVRAAAAASVPARDAGAGRAGPAQPAERAVTQSPPPGRAATNPPGERNTGQAGAALGPGAGAVVSPPAAVPGAGTAPPPAATTATGGSEPGTGATPEARCAGRNPLSHFVCMERECLRGRFKIHPECQAWRQQARPRDASGN